MMHGFSRLFAAFYAHAAADADLKRWLSHEDADDDEAEPQLLKVVMIDRLP